MNECRKKRKDGRQSLVIKNKMTREMLKWRPGGQQVFTQEVERRDCSSLSNK